MNPERGIGPQREPRLAVVPPGPVPPAGIGKDAAAWWRSVVETHDYTPSDLRLLDLAARALDQATKAGALLSKQGLVYTAADGVVRRNPAISIEAGARAAFSRLLRQLLPHEAPKRVPRNQWRKSPREG